MTEKELLGLINEVREMVTSVAMRVKEIERHTGICAGTYKGHTITAIHEPQFDDATKKTVFDPNESQPVDVLRTKEDVEKRLGVHIHDGNAPRGQWGSLKTLLGMEVIGVGKGKCEGCPQDHYGTPCIKVELVGGAYLCLAPLPNSIATE